MQIGARARSRRPCASATAPRAPRARGSGRAASRFSRKGRLTAPGTWPATASIGSTLPAKRSAPRTSTSVSPRASARGDAGGVDDQLRPRARHEARRLRAGVVGRDRPALGDPGRKAAVEHGDRVVAHPAQHPPEPRGECARARVVADDRGSRCRCRGATSVAANASGAGSGCRPVAAVTGAERSRSRSTWTAPGMWPGRQAARAGVGLAELEAAVGDEPVRLGQAVRELGRRYEGGPQPFFRPPHLTRHGRMTGDGA